MKRDIAAEIAELCEKRSALWGAGKNGEEVASITKKIDALYEEKRASVAMNGSPSARKKAIERAVAERELDRLMQA